MNVLNELFPVRNGNSAEDLLNTLIIFGVNLLPQGAALRRESEDHMAAIFFMLAAGHKTVAHHAVNDDRDSGLSHQKLRSQFGLSHLAIDGEEVQDIELRGRDTDGVEEGFRPAIQLGLQSQNGYQHISISGLHEASMTLNS